jgi:hypothetical protein
VQFDPPAALGAQEQRTRFGDGCFKILFGAGLDVDLGDFGDHWLFRLWFENARL